MNDPRSRQSPTLEEVRKSVLRVYGRCRDSVGDALHRVWIEERRSILDIAQDLGITLSRLRHLMGLYAIAEPNELPEDKVVQKIRQLYDEKQLGRKMIARALGVSDSWVKSVSRRYGIRRTKKEAAAIRFGVQEPVTVPAETPKMEIPHTIAENP